MVNYCISDATGRILRSMTIPAEALASVQMLAGERRWPYRGHPNQHYILDGQLADRPTMPITVDREQLVADGEDTLTFAGIPAGASLSLDGETYAMDGTPLELSIDRPGRYRARFTLWPYIDKEVSFEAASPI